jgi:Tol biopolymer transport system component
VPSNAGPQIYLRDMTSQTNAWLTRATVGGSTAASLVASPVVSTNGEFVMFISSILRQPLFGSSTGDTFLYRYDIADAQLTRITTTPISGAQSFALSEDGQWVAFATSSNHVVLHGFADSTNILVSRTADGQVASGIATDISITADGRYVVFASSGTNLVEGVTDELFQTYRFDRESGKVALLSRAASGTGGANHDTLYPTISADGSIVGFMTYASNLVTNDNPLSNDLFLVPASGTGSVILASAPHPTSLASGAAGHSFVEAQAISLDGRFVVFSSDATDLIPNDTNSARDIFIRDLQAGTTIRASNLPDGSAHTNAVTFVAASADAGRIVYTATESVENVQRRQIYSYDRAAGTNSIANILPGGTNSLGTLGTILLSADGRYLVFREGSGSTSPLFIRDLDTGTTIQHLPQAFAFGTEPIAISPNGQYLLTRHQSSTFALHSLEGPTYLTNIVSQQIITQPFSWDGSTMLISTGSVVASTLLLRSTDGSKEDVTIDTGTPLALSPDGNTVAYLRKDDTNQFVWFFDARTNSLTPMAIGGTNANVRVRPGSTFSADSRHFAFISTNSLTAHSPHPFNKIYIYDTVLKTLRLAAVNGSGDVAEFGAGNVALSANGRVIVFDTMAANLVASDLNLASDVFVNRFSMIDTDSDGLEDGWETIYFDGLTINSDTDSDGDGISNLDEFWAGTNPNSADSTFTMQMAIDSGTIVLTSPATIGTAYQLQFCDDLASPEWQTIGLPAVALSSSIAFEAALNGEATGFFRIIASQQ